MSVALRAARNLTISALAVAAGVALGQGTKGASPPADDRLALAAEFRASVEARDLKRLMPLVWKGGIHCGDGGVSKEILAEDLRNRRGPYHARLFDTRRMRDWMKREAGVETDAVAFEEYFRATSRRAVPMIEGDDSSGAIIWRARRRDEVGPIPAIEYLRVGPSRDRLVRAVLSRLGVDT